MHRIIEVHDRMQDGYSYKLTATEGQDFDPDFKPQLTPKAMLALGVFGGKYMTDCAAEFPTDWFESAKLCAEKHDAKLNFFKVNASQSLKVWRQNGWLHPEDPRGWFQWYCRYYLGRRLPEEDARQIKRWVNMRRHITQLTNSCPVGALDCQPRRRQALLHWAYDSRKF